MICTAASCAAHAVARGLCSRHYMRAKSRGGEMPPKMATPSLAERFWARVGDLVSDGCWEWQGATTVDGYGTMWAGPKLLRAHRISHELNVGPIPVGMMVCHTCDNPPCVRPSHLWLGTNRDNVKDAVAKGRIQPPRREALRFELLDPGGNRVVGENLQLFAAERGLTYQNLYMVVRGVRPRHKGWCLP